MELIKNYVLYLKDPKNSRWKYAVYLALIILLLGITLRFLRVILGTQPVFADEAIYIRWAQIMKAESTLRFLPLSDGKQPLFMWVVMVFLKIFNDPLIAGRMVSVVCSLFSMIGIFILSYNLFHSKKVSLVSLILLSLSPFFVFFDSLALVDSMLTMLIIWFVLFSYIGFSKIRFDMILLSGLTLGMAFLTKSPALFYLVLLPVYFVGFVKDFKNRRTFKKFFTYLFFLGTILILGLSIQSIMRLGPNYHMISQRNLDYVYPYLHILKSPLNPFWPHLKDYAGFIFYLGPIEIVLLFALSLVLALSKYKVRLFYLIVFFALPTLAVLEYSKTLTARYVLFALPFLFILSSLFLIVKSKVGVKIGIVLLSLFVVHSLVVDILLIRNPLGVYLPRIERSGYFEEWTSGYGIKEVSEYLKSYAKFNPGKKIVVGTEGYFGTLPDGLQIFMNDDPSVIVIGVGLNFTEVPKSLIDSRNSGNATFFVVNDSRTAIKNPEELGLELISSFPKAEKPAGNHETLLFYQLR